MPGGLPGGSGGADSAGGEGQGDAEGAGDGGGDNDSGGNSGLWRHRPAAGVASVAWVRPASVSAAAVRRAPMQPTRRVAAAAPPGKMPRRPWRVAQAEAADGFR